MTIDEVSGSRGRGGRRALRRLTARLPPGVELYLPAPDGGLLLADRDGDRALAPGRDLLRFIDDGQFARYLVGDAATSPERPCNATVKLGVVRPRSGFTPHAHRGEHVVLSLGHAGCTLYDAGRGTVLDVPLGPGAMIRIPELMPHSFANRGSVPLTILAANTGFGIDHEDYAITAAEAERRVRDDAAEAGRGVRDGAPTTGPTDLDLPALAAALRALERAAQGGGGPRPLTLRERLAAALRRSAHALEAAR